jgi:hypothetical protein
MKATKVKMVPAKLREGFTINPALDSKYENEPFFQDKIDRANHILKTVGPPKVELWEQASK